MMEIVRVETKISDMNFNVTLDRDKDGLWVVKCPSIPESDSQGETTT
jgi:predicted RNase H-like HicB family nuclease